MSEIQSKQRMILCGGLQSGDTTIPSHGAFSSAYANGVIDLPNDVITTSFEQSHEPKLWCKMTVGAFRWVEIYDVS
jgi:hypothetical protein